VFVQPPVNFFTLILSLLSFQLESYAERISRADASAFAGSRARDSSCKWAGSESSMRVVSPILRDERVL
jgi:hypothetical protein